MSVFMSSEPLDGSRVLPPHLKPNFELLLGILSDNFIMPSYKTILIKLLKSVYRNFLLFTEQANSYLQ